MASCSSPRPETWKASGESVSSTRMETLVRRLPPQALAELARGDELALAAGEGRVVDGEDHGDRGLVDRDGRQRHRLLARRRSSRRSRPPRCRRRPRCRPAPASAISTRLQPLVAVEHGDLGRARRVPSRRQHATPVVLADAPVEHAADGEAAHVVVVVEGGRPGAGAGISGSKLRRGDRRAGSARRAGARVLLVVRRACGVADALRGRWCRGPGSRAGPRWRRGR